MSVTGGRMRMDLAIKDLQTRWLHVCEHWNDPVSRAFEENYLHTLENAARLSGSALDKMRETISRVKRECDDR